jgi:serine/threonine protein phosphatase PrpC
VAGFGSSTLTGMEPGYAKTNQDVTLTLPTLRDNRHALFAVLDGHGSNGALHSDLHLS